MPLANVRSHSRLGYLSRPAACTATTTSRGENEMTYSRVSNPVCRPACVDFPGADPEYPRRKGGGGVGEGGRKREDLLKSSLSSGFV